MGGKSMLMLVKRKLERLCNIKVYFRAKNIARDKEGHFMIIREN